MDLLINVVIFVRGMIINKMIANWLIMYLLHKTSKYSVSVRTSKGV